MDERGTPVPAQTKEDIMWILAAAVAAFGLLVAAPQQESERQASAVPTVERGFLSKVDIWDHGGYASPLGLHIGGREGERIPFIRSGDRVTLQDVPVRWSEPPIVGPGSGQGFGASYQDLWMYILDGECRPAAWYEADDSGTTRKVGYLESIVYNAERSNENDLYAVVLRENPRSWLPSPCPNDGS